MALSILFGRKTAGKIGELTLDVSINETHSYVSDVTSFPVEDGATITDHVRKQPVRLSITGFITNAPVKLAGTPPSPVLRTSGTSNRVELARDYLIDLYNKSTLIDIIQTGLLVYVNMIMSSLSIPRGAQTGDAINFSAEFVQITKVQSEIVIIQNVSELDGRAPNINDQGQNTADTGRQTTKTPSQRSSILLNIVKGAAGL